MRLPISQEAIVGMVHGVTAEVLSTMLNLEARSEPPYTEEQSAESAGVVSFVGLAGLECAGTGSLNCDSAVACLLASRFLMAQYTSVDDDVLDAFGELTNMIIGNFKNEAEHRLGPMALSIPTVVYGRNFNTRSLGHQDWTVVPFSWEGNLLNVRVCLAARKSAAPLQHAEKHEFVYGT